MKTTFVSLVVLFSAVCAMNCFAQTEVPKATDGAQKTVVVETATASAELGIPLRPVIPTPIGKTTPAGWFDDWNRASAEAKRTNRPMLVLFTGSDWCHWCKVLHKEILDKPEFKHFADEKLILVYMDDPSEIEQPQRLQQTRNQLRRLLSAGDGVPSTVVLSPAGERWKCISGYAEDYLAILKELLKTHGF